MIKHLFTPYYSPRSPSHVSFPQLSTCCTFPFLTVPWHTLWHLTEVLLGEFPKSKRKAVCGDVLLNTVVLGCRLCAQDGFGEKEKQKNNKFLFLILFSGLFSVGSVAITLKTILHTLVKGVFGSLWRPIRTVRGGGLTPPADHTAFPFPLSLLSLSELLGHMGGGIAVSSLSSPCRESTQQLVPQLHCLCLYLVFLSLLLRNFISSFSCILAKQSLST